MAPESPLPRRPASARSKGLLFPFSRVLALPRSIPLRGGFLRLGLILGPIILSGLPFGLAFSKCPQFSVTQTRVAVCFSTHHPVKLRVKSCWLIRDLRPWPPHQQQPGPGGESPSPLQEASLCITVVYFPTSYLPVCARTQWAISGALLMGPSRYLGVLDAGTGKGEFCWQAPQFSPVPRACAQHSPVIFVFWMHHCRSQQPAQREC